MDLQRLTSAGWVLALSVAISAGSWLLVSWPGGPPPSPSRPAAKDQPALVALGPSVASAQFLSPGSLSRAHADLEGDGRCGECHASGRRVATGACLACHEELRAQVRRRAGLHGRAYRGRECGRCHVEHLGRGAPIVRWPGGSRDAFPHRETGYRLTGAHAEAECGDCHTARNRRGHATFLGLDGQRCASCHEDPHGGHFGTRCASCHESTAAFSAVSLDGFDHGRARFPLRGAHAEVGCAGCHGEPPRWSGLDFASCGSCHEDPHRGHFRGQDCSTCHSESSWQAVGNVASLHRSVPLRGGHRSVPCASCHDRGNATRPSRGTACVSCHAEVHDAPFGRDCRSCHASVRWVGLPDRVGREAHGQTPFPLVGEHGNVECAGCHLPHRPRAERYRDVAFERCVDCHRDPHPGDGLLGLAGDGDCASCHEPHGFAPSSFGVAGHAATGFALEGQHAAVPCAGCHDSARPRLDLRLSADDCASCHDNPHGDQFAHEMRTGGCASCHRPEGWDQPNVDHDSWPLTGAHTSVACSSCHRPSGDDGAVGEATRTFRGAPRECGGCHDDPHAGQFRLTEPRRECADCHRTERFAPLAEFDHEDGAGWALAGRHADAECRACHPTAELRNGERSVRWRLGYRACEDCHGNPHRESQEGAP